MQALWFPSRSDDTTLFIVTRSTTLALLAYLALFAFFHIICLLRKKRSFRSLASKGFPSGYSKSVCVCVCVSAYFQKTPNLRRCFRKRRLTNTPRRHRLADGQLSSLYAPLPSFSSFGAASMMCCSARPASWSAPSVLTRGSDWSYLQI